MTIANGEEAAVIRECGRRLAAVTRRLKDAIRPGISTQALDALAEELIRDSGGDPVFKGYRSNRSERPFPASICTSLNEEVVHGIPRPDRILKEGDIIGIDIGMRWPSQDKKSTFESRASDRGKIKNEKGGTGAGLITDMALTVPVGKVSIAAENLLQKTQGALAAGIGVLKPGIRLGGLGRVIQDSIESAGLSVVKDLVGHGVGRKLHEEPYVPNYGDPGEGEFIRAGMVLAIEPMAVIGSAAVELAKDGWTWRTADGSLAAHFEHTVLITNDGAEVLTNESEQ